MRVLCLDIEGGYGGSSRSLYKSLRYMDRGMAEPYVWCNRDGPIVSRYHNIGISCRHSPQMPKSTSVHHPYKMYWCMRLALATCSDGGFAMSYLD